jgi:uncharacterized protein HemX
MMDAGLVAGLAAGAVASVTAWLQFRAARHGQDVELESARTTALDLRTEGHFDRLDRALKAQEEKVERLERRVEELERENDVLRETITTAVVYIRRNGLPWPPQKEGTG